METTKQMKRALALRIGLLLASLVLTTSTNRAAAATGPVDEPFSLPSQTYKTRTIFTTPSVHRNANSCRTAVYKGNVYTVYARQGDERMMVAKIPLDGAAAVSQPLVGGTNPGARGYTLSGDNHQVWDVAVDRGGYIHVTGDMHTHKDMGYWRSDKPEDISSFTQFEWEDKPVGTPLRCPVSQNTTFPHFWNDRKGQLFWSAQQSSCFLPFCSYDETTKLWTPLGAPIAITGRENGKGHRGEICLAWAAGKAHSDSREKGGFGGSSFAPVWDSNNRLHMIIGMLDKDTHGPHPLGIGTDILYVYSDDGGKTVHRADGTPVQYPIRASSGPKENRGDIILEEMQDPNFNWINRNAGISLDKFDRPTIAAQSRTTGWHYYRLEDGHWVEHRDFVSNIGGVADPSGVKIAEDDDGKGFKRFWNPNSRNMATIQTPDVVHGVNKEHYRDTGELVWTSLTGGTFTIHRTVFDPVSKTK